MAFVGGDSTINFDDLITKYNDLQSEVMKQLQNIAAQKCGVKPGDFLLLQFKMSQLTQMGDSVSNIISQVNSVIANAVRNQAK